MIKIGLIYDGLSDTTVLPNSIKTNTSEFSVILKVDISDVRLDNNMFYNLISGFGRGINLYTYKDTETDKDLCKFLFYLSAGTHIEMYTYSEYINEDDMENIVAIFVFKQGPTKETTIKDIYINGRKANGIAKQTSDDVRIQGMQDNIVINPSKNLNFGLKYLELHNKCLSVNEITSIYKRLK